MAAVTRVTHQFGTQNRTRSTLVTNRELGDGHFSISWLGFDVGTRIKFLLLGRVPLSLSFPHTLLVGVALGTSLSGHGWPIPMG